MFRLRRPITAAAACLALTTTALADNFVTQLPTMSTSRSSQLWQDPGPDGNDLDGDAACSAKAARLSSAAWRRRAWATSTETAR